MNYNDIINGLKSRLVTDWKDLHGDLKEVRADWDSVCLLFTDGRWAAITGSGIIDNLSDCAFEWHPDDLYDGGVIDEPTYKFLIQERYARDERRRREYELDQLAVLKAKYEK